jgi:hypothetical protein
MSESTAHDIYLQYLCGFIGLEANEGPGLTAYALGVRDRAAEGTLLRACSGDGGVLQTVAKLAPTPRSVPVDVDALMAAGAQLATENAALKAEIARRDACDADRAVGGDYPDSKREPA